MASSFYQPRDLFFRINPSEDSEEDDDENVSQLLLDVRKTASFKGLTWAEEKTYRIVPQSGLSDVMLNTVLMQLEKVFEKMMTDISRTHDEYDIARLYIDHPKLESAIIVPPRPVKDMTAEVILSQIEFVLSSSAVIPLDNNLQIQVAVVKRIQGSGKSNSGKYRLDYERDRKIKRSVVRVPFPQDDPSDNNCLPRAIIVGLNYAEALADIENFKLTGKAKTLRLQKAYRSAATKNGNNLNKKAVELKRKLNISEDRPGLLEDIPLYEKFLRLSVCVVSCNMNDQIVYPGCKRYNHLRRIYLYHWKPFQSDIWHFDLLRKMGAFLEKVDYCTTCEKALSHPELHSCSNFCTVCRSKKCPLLGKSAEIFCPTCNFTCRSKECFERHKRERQKKHSKFKRKTSQTSSLCRRRYKCVQCKTTRSELKRPRKFHVCGEQYCNNCNIWTSNNDERFPHMCHMRALSAASLPEIDRLIFYDFETCQENGQHVPNLVIAQSSCKTCENEEVADFCTRCGSRCSKCDQWNRKEHEFEKLPCLNGSCGRREIKFRGTDVTRNFGKWLVSRQHKNCTVIAHNAKSFDNYFILKYLLEENILQDSYVIFNGSKAVYMKVGKGLNLRFLDSCMFLPMPLSDLPKCFDLNELKKGFFPHFYNISSNAFTVLPSLPPKELYSPSSMTEDKLTEFEEWYEKNKNSFFDFEKEMEEYCRSDVDILRRACLSYRQRLKEVTVSERGEAIDPFSFVSAASVSIGVFRSRFLKEKWKILRQKDVRNTDCSHDIDRCSCNWREAEKIHGDSSINPLTLKGDENENDNRVICEQFISSDLALIPPNEYQAKDNYSLEAAMWLKRQQEELDQTLEMLGFPKVTIQTATSSIFGEKIVYLPAESDLPSKKCKLDGFYVDPVTGWKVALEFYGCHWHGCPNCFPKIPEDVVSFNEKRGEKVKFRSKTMMQRREETLLRERRLQKQGYMIKSVWACQDKTEEIKPTKPSWKQNFTSISLRDAYFGGRTAALKFYYNFTKNSNEHGKYVDFSSLYPWALKHGVFPVSHPQRYCEKSLEKQFKGTYFHEKKCSYNKHSSVIKFCPAESHSHFCLNFFGIAKVRVLPPRNLLHPVLPYRCNGGKLIFPLCAFCGENNVQRLNCCCDEDKRSWTGTFCTPELEAALDVGYRILHWFEILHWPSTSQNIFSGYVNAFLKIKQEANGLPPGIATESEIASYIEEFKAKENIALSPEKIKKCSSLRSLAKLMLNSLYGKFGQRINLRRSVMINTPEKFCDILTQPSSTILDFHVLSENCIHVELETNPLFNVTDVKSNVIVSAFTTTYARLKLWVVMQQLGKRLLYTDTDSLIYISTSAESDPLTGTSLGELADELSCKKLSCKQIHPKLSSTPFHFISEFVAGGPKNYAYKLNSGETVCKIRGFTLDSQVAQHLNFHSLKRQIISSFKQRSINETAEKNQEDKIVVQRNHITRDKTTFTLTNRLQSKRYGVILDKNVIVKESFSSFPFGFEQQ